LAVQTMTVNMIVNLLAIKPRCKNGVTMNRQCPLILAGRRGIVQQEIFVRYCNKSRLPGHCRIHFIGRCELHSTKILQIRKICTQL